MMSSAVSDKLQFVVFWRRSSLTQLSDKLKEALVKLNRSVMWR